MFFVLGQGSLALGGVMTLIAQNTQLHVQNQDFCEDIDPTWVNIATKSPDSLHM